jgi:hypothetical protein
MSSCVFATYFLAATLNAATTPIVVTNAAVGNMGRVGDRYDWVDSSGLPRTALLARNNISGGGILDRYVYTLASNAVRTVNATASGAGGFGYVVSHLPYVSNCAATPDTQFCEAYRVLGDDSPLGLGFTGTYQVKFAGPHHAIHEFKTSYPRFTGPHPAGPKFIRYDLPVTIQWLFVNGRDHPLWSVTWDWTAVPAGLPLAQQIEGDSRGPYGEMDFDGVANSANLIGGVAWAVNDKRFTTTTAPFTLNSAWTWNTAGAAAIPYNMMWIHNGNAQMGVVQTSLLSTHDAGNGGYSNGGAFQNTTSGAGSACNDAPTYSLFCVWDWPYQSIENNFYGGVNVLPNNTTNGRRLAWGAKLGAIGRASYANYVNGSVTQAQAKSYSTFIVLGEHGVGVNPVANQVGELQNILKTVSPVTLTASVGTVLSTGPAGVARNDNQTYSRPGYNPAYATWDVTATANKATVNWAASGVDTLKNPVLRLLGYGLATTPSSVSFNGSNLLANVDYLASVDASSNTLWLTLLRTVSGPNNTVAINATLIPPCTMDIDGDGRIIATTDGLMLTRVMLGLRDTAVSSAAAPGSPRSTWVDIKRYLNESCAMGLP